MHYNSVEHIALKDISYEARGYYKFLSSKKTRYLNRLLGLHKINKQIK